jgi:hypothetical protein
MPGTVSTLVLVAQDPGGKGSHDKELLGFAHAWSKQIFSCTTAGCVETFDSYPGFLTKLKSFDKIDRLALLSHAAKDGLSFPAGVNTLTPKTLEEIVDDIDSDFPTVTSVEFLGCLVGRNVTGLWDFGTALHSKWVIAYTFAHAFEPFTVEVDPGDDEAKIEERMGDRSRYLLPNTDLGAVLADPKAQLWIEWYREFLEIEDTETLFTPFERADETEHKKSFFRRSAALPPTQVLTESDAQHMEQLWKKLLSPPFTRVEVLPGP